MSGQRSGTLVDLLAKNEHRAAIKVDVKDFQFDQLHASHAGRVERLEDSAVTQTESFVRVTLFYGIGELLQTRTAEL